MSDMKSSSPKLPTGGPVSPLCPRCQSRMVVQRVVPLRPSFEHWTFRCTKCGNIHKGQVHTDLIEDYDAWGWLYSELSPPK